MSLSTRRGSRGARGAGTSLAFTVLGALSACAPTYTASDDGNGTSGGATSGGATSGGATACMPRCDGATKLVGCDGSVLACDVACVPEAAGVPSHCARLEPEGPASAEDIDSAAALDELLLENVTVDSDRGRIELRVGVGGAPIGSVTRAANSDPRQEQVLGGVAFRIEGDRAILRARRIDVGEGVVFTGQTPLALLAATELRVRSALEVPCGTLGGGTAGHATLRDGGAGAGPLGGAGGGGGHQGAGGRGALSPTDTPSYAPGEGGAVGPRAPDRLTGGGAGGRGVPSTSTPGAGGGALQLIAGQQVVFEAGAGGFSGVLVGGCGAGMHTLTTEAWRLGSGGGAGGSLIVEAPAVQLEAGTRLLALGGGGSGYAWNGENAGWSGTAAVGGRCDGIVGNPCNTGGFGSSLSQLEGGVGGASVTNHNSSIQTHLQGGGGGSGWIVLRSANGQVAVAADVLIAPAPLQQRLNAP